MRRSEVQSSRCYSKSPNFYEEETLSPNSVDDVVMEGLVELVRSVNRREEQRIHLKRNKKKYASAENNSDSDQSYEDVEYSSVQERQKRHKEKKDQDHVQKVHEELCDINKKLQHENKRLRGWDLDLRKRESHLDEVEKQLSEYAASIQQTIEKEALNRCRGLEKEYELKIQQLQDDSKKSRNSFKIMKKANETLKSKVAEDESKLKSYEEKQSSLHSRISNLQRKIEILTEQINEQATKYNISMKEKLKAVHKNSKDQNHSMVSEIFYELFATLLQWIADVHLKQNVHSILKVGNQLHTEHDVNIELTNDRAIKIIIYLPNVLHQASLMSGKLQLSFLQFIYWSMLHLQITQCSQRLSHSATYRRIGEELYQGHTGKHTKEDSGGSKVFFRSLDYHIRILSSLIILHTITQADILVQVFQSINAELRRELSKELFLEYHGTEMVLPLFKLTNKVHLGYTTDILMILAVESPYMQQFLTQLGTVEWIQAIMSIMKCYSDDTTLMEKLSLLLQRLSKLRSMKPIFDALQVKSSITEISRLPNCDGEFLQLNLRSILFNIESMRTQKEK